MSDFVSRRPDASLDQWLADQHRHTVTDLATTLNLEAGLREAMIPVRHANLVADLGGVLNVEAGLSAIVPTAPEPTPHEHDASGYATDAELPTTEGFETDPKQASPDPTSLTDLEGLVRAAASWSLSTRLAMRNYPTFTLAHALVGDLAHERDRALDLASALAHTCGSDRASALDRLRTSALDRVLDRLRDDRDSDSDLASALASARDNALDLGVALAHYLARDLDHYHASAHASAGDLASALVSDLASALARASTLTRALDLAHTIARVLADTSDSDSDLDRIRDLARALASDLNRTTRLVADFYRALNDFTGADLSNVDLAGITLDRLRWSTATKWPPQWDEQVRRNSVQIGNGIFEVRGGNRHAPTTV
jgi:hypothetical protein